MIVNRIPIGALERIPPGRRPVMMPAPHDVMKAERRHVVHHSLVRFKHDASDSLYCLRVARERHLNPFVRNLPRGKVWIPSQATEGIPVGLREVMSSPVAIRASVCHARHACDALMV